MEMVDVVDIHLNVIHQVPKDEAHQKGLLHKTVIAEIINSRGQFLLVTPRSHKQDAGQFVSPVGGHVSAGEKNEDALVREVKEEVHISPPYKYKFRSKAIFDRHVLGRHENHYFILYEIYTNKKPSAGDESDGHTWFTKKQMADKIRKEPQLFGDAFMFLVRNCYPELLK